MQRLSEGLHLTNVNSSDTYIMIYYILILCEYAAVLDVIFCGEFTEYEETSGLCFILWFWKLFSTENKSWNRGLTDITTLYRGNRLLVHMAL